MKRANLFILMGVCMALFACGGGGNGSGGTAPPPAPPAGINVSGVVLDGPVIGGSIYVYSADSVQAALDAAEGAEDRAATLSDGSPLVTLVRDTQGDETLAVEVPGDRAGEALFFVFDSADAEDETFGGEPFNLEAVAVMPDAGDDVVVNLTPHTTMIAAQVRNALDPDADGTIISQADIATRIGEATDATVSALATNDLGEAVLSSDDDPTSSTSSEALVAASIHVGRMVRLIAALQNAEWEDVVAVLAADAADGSIDGSAPAEFELDQTGTVLLAAAGDAAELGAPDDLDGQAPSCSAATRQLRRACEFEVLDEYMIGKATCAQTSDLDEFTDCSADLALDRDEAFEECDDITEARLSLCEVLSDETHSPEFGADYAANFVDPRQIGTTVSPNPLFPLVVGNQWIFEGTFEEDGEMVTEVITITVLNETKRIDGIDCLVVRDVVVIDGELIEDTDDWIAQDVDGNLWYCGEEVKDYETFDGDDPQIAELVAIDGAFKAGVEGDKAGILLPAVAEVGAVFRQEVSFANAEDVIEILATDGSATTPAATCTGNCVVTRDFSPLDPGVEENKYYLPGVGKILEIDLETGDRVELISTNVTP